MILFCQALLGVVTLATWDVLGYPLNALFLAIFLLWGVAGLFNTVLGLADLLRQPAVPMAWGTREPEVAAPAPATVTLVKAVPEPVTAEGESATVVSLDRVRQARDERALG